MVMRIDYLYPYTCFVKFYAFCASRSLGKVLGFDVAVASGVCDREGSFVHSIPEEFANVSILQSQVQPKLGPG
jgi:hypothetical protein